VTLDELKAQLPPSLIPWAEAYGPALLLMTAQEIKDWIELLIRGDVLAAYKALLEKMPSGDLLAEWTEINAGWPSANESNVARMSLQRSAAAAALRILLMVALAAAGF